MTESQRLMLFGLWNTWRAALRRQGVPAKECDERRHQLTRQALGYDRSWRAGENWSQKEVDDLKGALLALVQSDNLNAQVDALEQPRKRKLWVIDQECGKLGKSRDYARGIARRMSHEGKIPSDDLETLDPKHLLPIITALKLQVKRTKSAKAAKAVRELTPAGVAAIEQSNADPDWNVE